MEIIFTKVSPTHHTLDVKRDDGTTENILLETKTFMPHDLIHLAYEKEAGLKESFWGLTASGRSLKWVNDKMALENLLNSDKITNNEAGITEMVTGALTGMLKGNATNEETLSALDNLFGAYKVEKPSHLHGEFLDAFKKSFNALSGEWNAMKKGEPMKVIF
jgi:hypothetical protein